MNLKRDYIKRCFTHLQALKTNGVFFSGIEGEGEFKMWHRSAHLLFKHCFFKGKKLNGESKTWYIDGSLAAHKLFKNGKLIANFISNPSLKRRFNIK